MMQDLYKQTMYPKPIRNLIEEAGQVGVELANRWMLGWPGRVEALIATSQYLEAFTYQLEQEQSLLLNETRYNYLTRTELYELFGQTAEPQSAD